MSLRQRQWMVGLAVALMATGASAGVDRYWNTATGWWDAPGSWNPAGIPLTGDVVHLNQVDSVNRLVYYYNPGASPDLNLLEIDATGSGRMTLIFGYLGFDHQLSCSGPLIVGTNGVGLVDHRLGTATFGGIHLGYNGGSSGVYYLSGGTLKTPAHFLTNTGDAGNGKVVHSGGTFQPGSTVYLGDHPGSTGTYELSAGRLEAADMLVGVLGTGSFIHSGGTHVATEVRLGDQPGGTGQYTLSNTGYLEATQLIIGNQGTGSFTQTGGTAVLTTMSVGYDGSGLVRHSGGTVQVSGNLILGDGQSSGSYGLSGTGRLAVGDMYVGDQMPGWFTQTGGSADISSSLHIGYWLGGSGVGGQLSMVGGTLTAKDVWLAYGLLVLSDWSAHLRISGTLLLGSRGTFTAAPDSVIHMSGPSVQNESSSPSALAGLSNTILVLEAGAEKFTSMEVAGRDQGPVLAGWSDNFALAGLQVGGDSPGGLKLVDSFDNLSGTEAMYTDSLAILAGGHFDLNGLNLYYLNGGPPKQFFMGDANLDGMVNVGDLGILAFNWGKGHREWAQADFTGDSIVNVGDLGVLAFNWGKQTPGLAGAVPEPATLSVLALGGLGVLRRRR